jgi:DNA-binding GntR family transcriptional regulator
MYHVYMIRNTIVVRAADQAYLAIRSLIADGEFDGDQRIEEIPLAERLGISRTPVREALQRLTCDGLVICRPNRGYRIVPADAELVRESYPILAGLEATAVRLAGKDLADAADELEALIEALEQCEDPAEQYELDHGFHRRLVRECGNARLLALIETERVRAQRFDGAHRRGTHDRRGSCAEHREILAAVRAGEFEKAASLVEAHWRSGVTTVLDWLADQPA